MHLPQSNYHRNNNNNNYINSDNNGVSPHHERWGGVRGPYVQVQGGRHYGGEYQRRGMLDM